MWVDALPIGKKCEKRDMVRKSIPGDGQAYANVKSSIRERPAFCEILMKIQRLWILNYVHRT